MTNSETTERQERDEQERIESGMIYRAVADLFIAFETPDVKSNWEKLTCNK